MRILLLFATLFMVASLQLTGQKKAPAAEDGIVLMPGYDGGHQVKTVTTPILFYDSGGEAKGIGSWQVNSITFKPDNPNEKIELCFEQIDLTSAFIKVYNGAVSVEGDEDAYVLPKGELIQLTGKQQNLVYTSTATDGSLSVGFSNSSGSGTGWKATVRSVTPKPMSLVSIIESRDGIAQPHIGRMNQPLVGIKLTTTGSDQPLQISKFLFDLSAIDNLQALDNFRIAYSGSNAKPNGNDLPPVVKVSGRQLEILCSQDLSAGDNYFWLIADVSIHAKPGQTLNASCLSATINHQDRACATSPFGDGLTVENAIRISSVHQTYLIGNESVLFYDDGGKDNNITQNFKGSVSFKPSVAGKKVMIRFVKLDLFNTSSTGNNDRLNVYHGSEVDPKQLAGTVLKDLTTLKSTARDGSLTVTLESVTGITKPGFEAEIILFDPAAMEVAGVVCQKQIPPSLAAGDKNIPLLSMVVDASNTEPPLEMERINIKSNQLFEGVEKTHLFYNKGTNDFATAIKLGDAVVDNGAYMIAIKNKQLLQEGKNYFWLACDLAVTAKNNSAIGAQLESIGFTSHTHSVVGEPYVWTVKNECVSTTGQQLRTVYEPWSFTHTKASAYSSKYKAENNNQQTTFLPGMAGNVVEIDFSLFDLYFASSSYGTKSVFKVYSGKQPIEQNLLWQLKNEADKTVGPRRTLRSASPDGALTVVFNANTTTSSYTANGWMAEVRQYQPQDMKVASVSAFQNNTAIIKPAAIDEEVLGIEIVTKGNLTSQLLEEIVFDLKGCGVQLAKATLYQTQDKQFATGTPVCHIEAPGAVASFKPDKGIELVEGSNFFWLAVDVKENALSGEVVDAKLDGVTVGGDHPACSATDPEGHRVITNVYEMKNGHHTVNVSGSMMFYDNGGASGKYTKEVKGSVTFVPRQGEIIKVVVHQFQTNINDNMFVYSGVNADASSQIAKWYSTTVKVKELLSTSQDGCITFKFEPKYSGDGWAIEVLSYKPLPLTVSSVATHSVSAPLYLRGMSNHPVMRIDVAVAGDRGQLNVDAFHLSLRNTSSLSDLANLNLYYTDTISNFNGDRLYAKCTLEGQTMGSGDVKIVNPGVYKFWLTYDIAPSAQVNNHLETSLLDVTIDQQKVLPTAQSTVSGVIGKGSSGLFRVGSSAKAGYKTISAAISELKNGIDGPVIIEVENGTYKELVSIPAISGASNTNTITIRSVSGNYRDVLVTYHQYSEPPYSDDKMFHEYGVFTINGADYLTIEGISFGTQNTKFPSVVHIKNQSEKVTLRNCRVNAPMTTVYNDDINLVYMYAQNKPYKNNDGLCIDNCRFEGGYIGVRLGGTSYVALPMQSGGRIVNSTFVNQGSKGIYVDAEARLEISGNRIVNDATTATTFSAIDIRKADALKCIQDNVVTLSTGNSATGITLRPANGVSGNPGLIFNNEINFLTSKGTSYGIDINSDCSHLILSHNTIRLQGANSNSACLFLGNPSGDIDIVNNILQNEAGGWVYRVNKESVLGSVNFSNNALHTNNVKSLAYVGKELDGGFNGWTAISKETNSINLKASFFSNDILELENEDGFGIGKPMAFAAKDRLGRFRSLTAPTLGAYTYTSNDETPLYEDSYPAIVSVGYHNAEATVKTSAGATVYYLVVEQGVDAPEKEAVMAGKSHSVKALDESSIVLEDLESQTGYLLYSVLKGLRGQTSDVMASQVFTTVYTPTTVSTFENVTAADGGFNDGTAFFSGFSVASITDGVGSGNSKAALLNKKGKVQITNSAKGLPLTGFFLKSDALVQMVIRKEEVVTAKETLQATGGKWIFVDLKQYGPMTAVELASEGNVWIDNFSGQPQNLFVKASNVKGRQGERLSIPVIVDGGVAPYTFQWFNGKKELISTEREYAFDAQKTNIFNLLVTDAWGNRFKTFANVSVVGSAYTATFDDLYLDRESYWRGDEENDKMYNNFISGSYSFTNVLMKEYATWGLFGYSNLTATDFTPANFLTHQFRSATGIGVNGSDHYAVVYAYGSMGQTKIGVENNPEGDRVDGFYLTNSAWVKYVAANGTGMDSSNKKDADQPFTYGDWYKVVARGSNGKSVEYYLADYRSSDPRDHYTIDTWEWVDASSLGVVKNIIFTVEGSRRNSQGLTIPAYFCMDDFNGKKPVQSYNKVFVGVGESISVNLANYLGLDETMATIAYEVEQPGDNGVVAVVMTNGLMKLSGLEAGEAEVTVKASQKGRSYWVTVPVSITSFSTGVVETEQSSLTIYPNPVADHLFIKNASGITEMEIYDLKGVKVKSYQNMSDGEPLNVNDLAKGIYLLKIHSNNHTSVLKFVKK